MIEKVIDLIVSTMRASSGDDLTGFLQDTDYALTEDEGDVFESVDVSRSEDPRSLVNARALLRPNVASLQDVSHALSRACQYVTYNHFQASGTHWYREATVLRFVTVISKGAFFVTGTFTATGESYPRLVERYDREFASLTGPVEALPAGKHGAA